jgi:ABC-type uncharacterized transport system permease subunit
MGSLENQIKAGKNYKAPKGYKPLTTKQKVGMVAAAVGPGKVVKAVSKVAKVIKAETKAAGAAQKIKSASGAQAPRKVSGPPPGVSSNAQVQRKGSVKLVNPTNSMSRATRNITEDIKAQNIKSGAVAKANAQKQENWNRMNPGGKKSTIKINSNPSRGK